MYDKLIRYGLSVAFGIAVVCIAIAYATYSASESVDLFINIAILFVGIAIVTAICLPLYNAKEDPKMLLKTVVGIVGLLVFFGIAWGMADEVALTKYAQSVDVSDIKLSGALIITTRILLIVAVLCVVATEIRKIVKL